MKSITCTLLFAAFSVIDFTALQSQPINHNKETAAFSIELLEIYPNPTSDYLNIVQQHFDGKASQLEIVDLSGHTVYHVNEKFTQLSIYVGNWKKGIYMVFFHKGDKDFTYKIVVQ